MIQEKDFLYRVPVKTAPITTPRGQIRNPEILVDLEGGEFMHGNILDANSTNKLINQSVKDAVDDKLNESGYLTKDLLEAETSARTKGDEDLGAKIQAEQTRAEGKEKEISDKLAIVDGDSNTEGSFRKAIADVIAAAPEDLDTLKEIADKLAGNDDLHTALNQAITEKADATQLSNYVLTTALNQQVDTLNTAISAKQDAGSYIPYDQTVTSVYKIDKDLMIENSKGRATFGTYSISALSNSNTEILINPDGITMKDEGDTISLGRNGIVLPDGDNDHVLTSFGSTLNMANYLKESDVSGQFADKADRSDLMKLEQKVIANTTALERKQDEGCYVTYSSDTTTPKAYEINRGITLTNGVFKTKGIESTNYASFSSNTLYFQDESDRVIYGANGIHSNQHRNCVLTTDNEFKSITDFASAEQLQSVQSGLSAKQNKITVNEVDVTDIETADITKLRTIVINLINALSESNLIRQTQAIE